MENSAHGGTFYLTREEMEDLEKRIQRHRPGKNPPTLKRFLIGAAKEKYPLEGEAVKKSNAA